MNRIFMAIPYTDNIGGARTRNSAYLFDIVRFIIELKQKNCLRNVGIELHEITILKNFSNLFIYKQFEFFKESL